MFLRVVRRLTIAFLLLITPAIAAAAEQPVSLTLFKQALQLLEQGQAEAALTKLQHSIDAQPNNPVPHAAMATVYNRLRRPDDALRHAERAWSLGLTSVGLRRERATALLGLRRWDDALVQLRRLEEERPGEAKTSELTGRAYLGKGDHQHALAAFAEAETRDPAFLPRMKSYRAIISAGRGERKAATREVFELLRDHQNSAIGRVAKQNLAQAVLKSLDKPWAVTAQVYFGYNDNVIGLGDDIPLPAGISDQDSPLLGLTASASYRWRPDAESVLSIGYDLDAGIYSQLRDFDFDIHTVAAEYGRRLGNGLAGALNTHFSVARVDGDGYRNQVGLRPALAYRWSPLTVSELNLNYQRNDYRFTPFSAAMDRDGDSFTLGLHQQLTPPGTDWVLTGGLFAGRHRADGADFDFDRVTLLAGAQHPLGYGLEGELAASYSRERYDNLNSLAGPTGLAFRRKDDITRLSAILRWPVHTGVTVFARYDYTGVDSNIGFYEYQQHSVASGVRLRF